MDQCARYAVHLCKNMGARAGKNAKLTKTNSVEVDARDTSSERIIYILL